MFEQQTMTAAAFCLNLNHLFLRMHLKNRILSFFWYLIRSKRARGKSGRRDEECSGCFVVPRDLHAILSHWKKKSFVIFISSKLKLFTKVRSLGSAEGEGWPDRCGQREITRMKWEEIQRPGAPLKITVHFEEDIDLVDWKTACPVHYRHYRIRRNHSVTDSRFAFCLWDK